MAAIKQLAAVTRSGIGKGAARSVRRGAAFQHRLWRRRSRPSRSRSTSGSSTSHLFRSVPDLDLRDRHRRPQAARAAARLPARRGDRHADARRLLPPQGGHARAHRHAGARDQPRCFARPQEGGAVNLVLHSVELIVPAKSIPKAIVVDLTGLDFHDSVHVTNLKLPQGCKPADTRIDYTVVTVVPPTIFTEETPVAAAAATTAAAAGAPAPPPPCGAGSGAAGAAAPAAAGAAAAPAKGARRRRRALRPRAPRRLRPRRPARSNAPAQRRASTRQAVRPSRRARPFKLQGDMLLIAGSAIPAPDTPAIATTSAT